MDRQVLHVLMVLVRNCQEIIGLPSGQRVTVDITEYYRKAAARASGESVGEPANQEQDQQGAENPVNECHAGLHNEGLSEVLGNLWAR